MLSSCVLLIAFDWVAERKKPADLIEVGGLVDLFDVALAQAEIRRRHGMTMMMEMAVMARLLHL
jgi:hypothetical protein